MHPLPATIPTRKALPVVEYREVVAPSLPHMTVMRVVCRTMFRADPALSAPVG